ncbi:MAG: hypothetical protein K2Y01_09910 [Rhabdochlamydiaceae bacterium]|nr:hypothetical protein [Rhabdochlamydiaceae bacterium]
MEGYTYELSPECKTKKLATIREGRDRPYLNIGSPIRVISEVIIGNTDQDMEFNIAMEKLDGIDPPSTQYPIIPES